MRFQSLLTAALLTSLASADAISLADFTPRNDNLPSACDRVYNEDISGCTQKDFQTTCSSACITGLVAITKAIAAACANVDVAETSIIGVFLLGQGIPALCSNTVVATVSSSTPAAQSTSSKDDSSSSSSSSTSEAAAASSTTAAIIVDPSATPAKPSSTTLASSVKSAASSAAASSAAVTSQPVAASSATSATFALSSTSTSSSAAAKKTGKSQLSNSSSGGGSPFDVQATAGSARRAPRGVMALILGLAGMMLMVR